MIRSDLIIGIRVRICAASGFILINDLCGNIGNDTLIICNRDLDVIFADCGSRAVSALILVNCSIRRDPAVRQGRVHVPGRRLGFRQDCCRIGIRAFHDKTLRLQDVAAGDRIASVIDDDGPNR